MYKSSKGMYIWIFPKLFSPTHNLEKSMFWIGCRLAPDTMYLEKSWPVGQCGGPCCSFSPNSVFDNLYFDFWGVVRRLWIWERHYWWGKCNKGIDRFCIKGRILNWIFKSSTIGFHQLNQFQCWEFNLMHFGGYSLWHWRKIIIETYKKIIWFYFSDWNLELSILFRM